MRLFAPSASRLMLIGLLLAVRIGFSAASLYAESAHIISTNPEDSTVGVDVNTPISITFSEDTDLSGMNSEMIHLYRLDNSEKINIPGKVNLDASSRTVYFIPEGDLSYSTNYILIMERGVKPASWNTFESDFSLRFTTKNSTGGCGGS